MPEACTTFTAGMPTDQNEIMANVTGGLDFAVDTWGTAALHDRTRDIFLSIGMHPGVHLTVVGQNTQWGSQLIYQCLQVWQDKMMKFVFSGLELGLFQHHTLTQLTEAYLNRCNALEKADRIPGKYQTYSCGVINISTIQDTTLPQDVNYRKDVKQEKAWSKDRSLAHSICNGSERHHLVRDHLLHDLFHLAPGVGDRRGGPVYSNIAKEETYRASWDILGWGESSSEWISWKNQAITTRSRETHGLPS